MNKPEVCSQPLLDVRSFQNDIPVKLYSTQDVKLDLCESPGTKTQAHRGAGMISEIHSPSFQTPLAKHLLIFANSTKWK